MPYRPGSFYGELNKTRKKFLHEKRQKVQKAQKDKTINCNKFDWPELAIYGDYVKESTVRAKEGKHPLPLRKAKLPRLGLVPIKQVLSNLLTEIKTRHEKRYSHFLDEFCTEIEDILLDALTPDVKAALELGDVGFRESAPGNLFRFIVLTVFSRLVGLVGNPEDDDGPGIYLHILSPKPTSMEDNAKVDRDFWLYIGQSFQMRVRIADHNNKEHRTGHSSLHYSVWDSTTDMDSIFVKLASFRREKSRHLALLLNIEEMLLSCVFQTLRSKDLQKYLPKGYPMPWAGYHLNVALPLWQGFSDEVNTQEVLTKDAFQDALLSANPLVRKWAEDLRDGFHDLASSPEPMLRDYWRKVIMNDFVKIGKDAIQLQKLARYRRWLLDGVERKVLLGSWGHPYAYLGEYIVYLGSKSSFSVRIEQGDAVCIQPFLTTHPSPLRYAQAASDTDPCSRLVIYARIKIPGREDICRFVKAESAKQAKLMNSLVDIFEGVPLEVSRSLKNRGYCSRRGRDSIYCET